MATYIPNATQTTEPVESRTVESAALEFRTLKASINTEVVNRIAGDANLQTQNNAQDVRLTAIENALPFIGEGVVPGTVYVQRLSGTGAQTVFTLNTAPQSNNVVDIYINGLYQNKDTFTVSGADVIFSDAPPAGTNNIEVQVTVTIALGETDASLVTYGGTTVAAQLDAITANFVQVLADAFKGGNQSLSGNGYQKLPGGLIVQWGSVLSANVATTTVNYPIAFPNNCFQVVASGYNVSGYVQAMVTVNSPSGLSSALFNAFFAGSPGVAMSLARTSQVRIQYIAIGN